MRYEWDDEKNRANQAKHGVRFEEAIAVFAAVHESFDIFDESHSDEEDRFITIGPATRGVTVVVWTERDVDVIRVISARLATKRERELYLRHMENRG